MKISKKLFIILALVLSVFSLSAIFSVSSTYAASDICSANVSSEIKKANGCSGNAADIGNVVVNIINAVVGVLGIVAAIFIVVGGVNYMTSAGDAGKLQKAKNTILYALIGLVICVLAFAIVNFVIVKILGDNEEEEDSRSDSSSVSLISSDTF